jgi:hypothetical protein
MLAASFLCLLATQASPAARGLDMFMFGATTAPSGALLPLEVVVLGFPKVTRLEPLADAVVEAVWDPTSVGADLPPIRGRTDRFGRVILQVPVPEGSPAALSLLLRAAGGGRERTRTLSIQRTRTRSLRMYVADTAVVPGSVVSAWLVSGLAGETTPLPYATVEVELLEGGRARWRQRVRTDAGGSASVRIPIPRTRELAWTWTARASLLDGAHTDVRAEATLRIREETPGRPSMWASFEGQTAEPGELSTVRLRVRDAAGQPLGNVPLTYWIGSQGAQPTSDAGWKASATATVTPASGELVLQHRAPTTFATSGSNLVFQARAALDGHALQTSAAQPIGRLEPTVELITESVVVVPGLPQRALLRVRDGDGVGIAGRFELSGDGLATTVETDIFGEAALAWTVPAGVGAHHPSGSCAESVAATVVIRPLGKAAEQVGRARLDRCVVVDRDARLMLVTDRPVVRAGDRVRVRVLGGAGQRFSVLARADDVPLALHVLDDGARGAELLVPETARGLVQLSAIAADPRGPAPRASTSVLVLPRVIPQLRARLVGGRAVPGGEVEVEAILSDERGQPLVGTVGGTVHDLHGGGSTLMGLDAREQLTRGLDLGNLTDARRAAFFDGTPSADAWRRAALSGTSVAPLEPLFDPASDARQRLEQAFAQVVHSLEGAVLEATASPDRLADVRRKTARGYELNPELLTLVTEAMESPPETPGGEPLVLEDLMALDPQVRFDRVARRIARLKLFRVLEQVRAFVYEQRLLPDELALEAPDAILRRLVREGQLEPSALLDPWGGSIGFVKTEGPRVPYLSIIRGAALHAAGPDGRLGTADDVRDPFERVLTSGSPYAVAVDEDRLIDARYEVVVGDATVEAWRTLFETFTGTSLGAREGSSMGIGGLGSRGYGSGGGGIGHASYGRGTTGRTETASRWLPPMRTDARGRVVLRVPLGDVETTYRVTLVGSPDGGMAATTVLDVPAALPLSTRVEAGVAWTVGDTLEVQLRVRSHQPQGVRATLTVTASGALERVGSGDLTVDVPTGGVNTTTVRVRAVRPGAGALVVHTRAPGLPSDTLTHTIAVRAAGTEELRWTSAWIDHAQTLQLPALRPGHSRSGLGELTLTRGPRTLVVGALDALEPDALANGPAMAEAFEAATRLERWARARLDVDERLADRAADVASRALGRALTYRTLAAGTQLSVDRRLASWSRAPLPELAKAAPSSCPDALGPAEVLELEPAMPTAVVACWENAVATALTQLIASGRTDLLARGVIALAERPHRRHQAENLAQRLAERGEGVLPEGEHAARASRALAAAARLRWPLPGSDPARAWEALAAAAGPDGGYGDPTATRVVMTALLGVEAALGPSAASSATVTIELGAPVPLVLALGAEHQGRVTLPRTTDTVTVQTEGGPVLARFSAPTLRDWNTPPTVLDSPIQLELEWPTAVVAGQVAVLRGAVRTTLMHSTDMELRLVLPPGATLAEGRPGLVQSQGVLVARLTHAPGAAPTLLEVPLRFTLAGTITAPEAEARILGMEGTRTLARATRIVVQP